MAIQKPFAVLPLALSNITTGNAKANRPATHLALPQYPGMRWESNGNGNLWVRGQFGGATEAINFMSLMGTNAQAGTLIRLRLGTSQAQVDGTAPYDSTALPFIVPAHTRADGRYHSHLEIPTTQDASWWRIDISGHDGDFVASSLIFGSKRTPARFYNRDREIGFEDLGSLEISRNGVVAETPGYVLRTLLFRLQWVSNEEFWSLWAPLAAIKGKRQLIYWCFDPEATVRRQDQSFLGYMARDIFMRGNDFPKDNQMDFQIRALPFPAVPPPPPITYEAETDAYLAAMSTQPDAAQAGRIDALVVALKAAGVWSKLSWLALHAAHDEQAGRINLINPAQIATAVNSPSFTLYRGFTGNGTSSYLNTGLTIGTNIPLLTQNSAHMGVWVGTNVNSASQIDIGGRNRTSINSRNATSTASFGANVASPNSVALPAQTSIGHTSWSRSNSANYDAFKNGSLLENVVTASTALNAAPVVIGCGWDVANNKPTSFSTRQIAVSHFGGALNATEMDQLYAALNTYITALP